MFGGSTVGSRGLRGQRKVGKFSQAESVSGYSRVETSRCFIVCFRLDWISHWVTKQKIKDLHSYPDTYSTCVGNSGYV